MAKLKPTFKKYERQTGLAGIGYPYQSADIKLGGKVVGMISAPSWQTADNKWGISFSVMKSQPDDNPNCEWKHITLKVRLDTYEEAKQFIKDNIDKISERFTFYYQID